MFQISRMLLISLRLIWSIWTIVNQELFTHCLCFHLHKSIKHVKHCAKWKYKILIHLLSVYSFYWCSPKVWRAWEVFFILGIFFLLCFSFYLFIYFLLLLIRISIAFVMSDTRNITLCGATYFNQVLLENMAIRFGTISINRFNWKFLI